ncbi:MAG: hypothetical protein EOO43_22090 [Flavobacterium sp.]|nr:MAG: hypothetical protein EOO43_22090 [Flavobacterium sp.]
METTIKIVSLVFLVGLLFSPVLIGLRLNKSDIRHKFVVYLTISILITATIALTFGWWAKTSDELLLEYYGYNFQAMNAAERFENVSANNMEQVENLEKSLMGIGWPLKVIMTYVFYFPYLLIVYSLTSLFKEKFQNNQHKKITQTDKSNTAGNIT